MLRVDPAQDLVPVTEFGAPYVEFDFPSVQVGIAEYEEGPTGCTLIAFPKGADSVVDVRGGLPGTVMGSTYEDGHTSGVCLSGGSIFGFAAISGALLGLSSREIHVLRPQVAVDEPVAMKADREPAQGVQRAVRSGRPPGRQRCGGRGRAQVRRQQERSVGDSEGALLEDRERCGTPDTAGAERGACPPDPLARRSPKRIGRASSHAALQHFLHDDPRAADLDRADQGTRVVLEDLSGGICRRPRVRANGFCDGGDSEARAAQAAQLSQRDRDRLHLRLLTVAGFPPSPLRIADGARREQASP